MGFMFAQKMMPAVREAIRDLPVGLFIDIDDAPVERDMMQATDLILRLEGGDIAVRVRRHKYLYIDWPPGKKQGYLDFDWSVRWVNNGYKTEIDKLREGFAKWYFFGIANESETGFDDWAVIDLDAVRNSGILDLQEEWEIWPNHDGTAGGYLPMRRLSELDAILATNCSKYYFDN